jgi:D-arabinose 1-dehydrogenase-like Zn-dependent alcohol dehydrogenase
MPQMTAVQIRSPGGPFEVSQRDIPAPGANRVRIKVQACGICHSDMFVKEGYWPGLQYPRVTGHEVAGLIDEVGPGVTMWKKGQRVGVGWHGGHCGQCVPCRRGDFMGCQYFQVTGFQEDGGYAQYMIARSEAVAAIPEVLSPVEAAPILCAGVTTFNSLRHSGAQSGDLVAVQGLGGLGHLGVQFASKMGFHTVAIGRGKDKESLAMKLGAARYLDTEAVDAAKELTNLGGASVILATAPDSKAMSALIDGLGVGRSTHHGSAVRSWLAIRHGQRFRRHVEVLCPDGDSRHGGDAAARTSRCGLRAHDKRQSTVSDGAHHELDHDRRFSQADIRCSKK